MSLIERDPTCELLVPPGIEVAPTIPVVASNDRRPMWEIMGYESLEDMDSAFFSDEAVVKKLCERNNNELNRPGQWTGARPGGGLTYRQSRVSAPWA
ncbi:MAG TPA: hypothetical protein VK694_05635 [Verrucomicrobiae bacterium]|nr:hypothetical protein [Verrucomicrobiae bacterium]